MTPNTMNEIKQELQELNKTAKYIYFYLALVLGLLIGTIAAKASAEPVREARAERNK